MDEPMMSREAIRARARKAHAEGKGRDQHGFEHYQLGAIAVWQTGVGQVRHRTAARRAGAGMTCENPYCELCAPPPAPAVSPNVQSAPATRAVVDPHQVALLFSQLSAYGQSVVYATLTSAARLDGVQT